MSQFYKMIKPSRTTRTGRLFFQACLVLLFFGATLHLNGQACYIDQPESNSFANVSTTTAAGQSFTACTSGVITSIRVNFTTMDTDRMRLQLSSGANTLNPTYTQDFETKGTGDLLIQLATPFPVEEAQIYAFTVIGIEGDGVIANLSGFNGNPYTEGNAITESNGNVNNFGTDVKFSISIVENACTINQPESNSFANVSTGTAAGQNFVACTSGLITHLRVSFATMDTDQLRLQLSSGTNTLNPEYSQDFMTNGTGDLVIPLYTPFPVEASQTYAFTVIGISGDGVIANLNGFNGNPYPEGNAITESNGNVNNFGTDVDFTLTIIEDACNVDQPLSNSFANVSTTTAAGQTFVPCSSGVISQIRVNFATMDTDRMRLQLSSGANTLNPEYNQEFSTNGTGDLIINLNTAFPVEASQTYAFTVIGIEGDGVIANLSGFNGNPYPEGNAITESNGNVNNFGTDVDFTVTIIEESTCNASSSVSNVSLNGGGSEISVVDTGAMVEISLDYTLANGISCPSCIRQIVFGYENEAIECAYDGIPAVCPDSTTGNFTGTFTAPTEPGTYDIFWTDNFEFTCDDAKAAYPDKGKARIATITVTMISSQENIEKLSDVARVYPNPANDRLIIEKVDGYFEDMNLSIINMTGQVVLEEIQNNSTISRKELEVSSLPKGAYFLRIRTRDGIFIDKILIQ